MLPSKLSPPPAGRTSHVGNHWSRAKPLKKFLGGCHDTKQGRPPEGNELLVFMWWVVGGMKCVPEIERIGGVLENWNENQLIHVKKRAMKQSLQEYSTTKYWLDLKLLFVCLGNRSSPFFKERQQLLMSFVLLLDTRTIFRQLVLKDFKLNHLSCYLTVVGVTVSLCGFLKPVS